MGGRRRWWNGNGRISIFLLLLLQGAVSVTASTSKLKTVYACQGSHLALSCPPQHQIRVVRANYGRFSVAICNDKGITDWSVNCMAPRSLRIMQDRCDSLASCIVPSSLEGVTDRYDEETGELVLRADRCPYRGQNEDYCKYLLTALLHESWTQEDWEQKGVEDREEFSAETEVGSEARLALQQLLNTGENQAALDTYAEEVRKLLGLPAQSVTPEIVK